MLHQLPVRLGRNAMNDCVILHPFVSDFHASIEMADGELCVRDLNSRNGLHDRNLSRLPAGRSVPLDSLGNGFVVGRAVEVEVEPFDARGEVGERSPTSVHGAVLGNQAAMGMGRSGSVPALPPLSMGMGGGQPGPGPLPVYVPQVVAPGAMGQSLPMLAPLASMGSPAVAPYGAPSQGGGPGNRNTQHLSMSMELLALLGLRELAGSLVPGIPLETTGDVARLLTKMHDLVEMFCRCFVPLRDSRLGASRWARRMAGSKSASEIDHSANPAIIASALLDWRNQDYDGPEAVERILADVVVQQAALLEGVMRGVGALLEEISPETIEQAARDDAGMGSVFGRYRTLWQTFKERFEQVSREERRAELLLGAETAAAYRKHLARQRGAGA